MKKLHALVALMQRSGIRVYIPEFSVVRLLRKNQISMVTNPDSSRASFHQGYGGLL